MSTMTLKKTSTLIALLSGLLIAAPVLADKPDGVGKGGKNHKESRGEDRDGRKDDRRGDNDRRDGRPHFEDNHRVVVREYYGAQFQRGRCPPGLAKKNNGCMPPGQAKKWTVGRPLPRDVIYYDVPDQLVVQIGRPLPGYKYVRVASDILLIAVGTGMIMDAIEDLGR